VTHGDSATAEADEPASELDPTTWNAMVRAMQAHGVPDETIGKVCADTLAAINSAPKRSASPE
jgi:hypothetical protein